MPRSTVTETTHPSVGEFELADADPPAAGLRVGEVGPKGEGVPLRLGRYRRGEPIGRGGMGVVFTATDTVLSREVAIKVVRGRDDVAGTRGAERLRAEAVTLASLNHPNVLTVLDVGTEDGEVFVVLEKIEGSTLDEWLGSHRTRGEILRVLTAAASGLGAAHDAGVVHRDFKPANLLVATDGRVVVCDFGLAQLRARNGDSSRTRGGTRGYMAPEVVEGEAATAASDQYSFAMTVHEVLGGERFETNVDLPPAIRAALPNATSALRRALQLDPRARFSSVPAFVAALTEPKRPTKPAHIVVATILAAIAVAPLLAVDQPRADDPCDRAEARVSLAISRALSEQAWVGAGGDLRPATDRALDRASASSCSTAMVATLVSAGEVSARRAEFDRASGLSAQGFLIATEAGDDPARASAALLLATIEGVYRSDQKKAQRWLRHAAAASEESSVTVRARIGVTEGAIAMRAGDVDGALAAFRRALELIESDADPDPRILGGVRANLGAILAQRLQFDEALEHLGVASAEFESAAGPNSPAVASVLSNRASVLRQVGRVPEAIADYERALEIIVPRAGPNHPNVATIEVNLGQLELLRGRPSEARTRLARAVDVRHTVLGADDPETGRAQFSLAEAQLELGSLDSAEIGFVAARETLALTKKAHLAAYPEIGLARVDLARGDARSALRRVESALPSIETGPWFSRAQAYETRGGALEATGDRTGAASWFAASLAAYEIAGPAFERKATQVRQSMDRISISGDNR